MRKNGTHKSRYRGYDITAVKPVTDKSKRWLSKNGEEEFFTASFVEAMNTIDDKLEEQKKASVK